MTGGAAYWIVVLGKGGAVHFRYQNQASCLSQRSRKRRMKGLPGSWRGVRMHGCPVSAYVSGTLALPVGTPPPLAPKLLSAPVVSGSAKEGQALTTSTGAWMNNPSAYSYAWEDCNSSGASCSRIGGASSERYVLKAADVGHTIRSVVTASTAGGAVSASSAHTAVVSPPAPVNTKLPTISGTAEQGQTLTASNGSWSNSPSSYSYAWEDCNGSGDNCSDIDSATSSTYLVASGDVGVGDTIRVVVTATNAGGSASATSAQTGAVQPPPAPLPVNTVKPVVSGSAIEGLTLTTSQGSWSNDPTSFAYAWEDCNSGGGNCSRISGATSDSYVLGSGDIGHTIRSVVTATNDVGSTAQASAQTTAVIRPAPVNTKLPTISGTLQQGQTVTATSGTWSNSPTSYGYQWQDCVSSTSCSNISGATSSSYKLKSTDVGDDIDVIVTATNAGGSGSATSAAVGPVQAPPPPVPPSNTEPPSISGTPQQGDATARTARGRAIRR